MGLADIKKRVAKNVLYFTNIVPICTEYAFFPTFKRIFIAFSEVKKSINVHQNI